MRRRIGALTLVLGGALAAAACNAGSTGPGGTGTITGGGVAYFVIQASGRDTVTGPPGSQSQVAGTAYDAALNPVPLLGDTTWVSRDTTVATVDVHGLVKLLATGNTWVVGGFTPQGSQVTYTDSIPVIVLGPS